jgi:hypothetical protein
MLVNPSEMEDMSKLISGMDPVCEKSILNKSDAYSVTTTRVTPVLPTIVFFLLVQTVNNRK